MAIDNKIVYSEKFIHDNPDYPYGEARDVSTPLDGTGTPWEKNLINDRLGFQQFLLKQAGITPSGVEDTADASDVADAVSILARRGVPLEYDQAESGSTLNVLSNDGITHVLITTGNTDVEVILPAAAQNVGRAIHLQKVDNGTGLVSVPDFYAPGSGVGQALEVVPRTIGDDILTVGHCYGVTVFSNGDFWTVSDVVAPQETRIIHYLSATVTIAGTGTDVIAQITGLIPGMLYQFSANIHYYANGSINTFNLKDGGGAVIGMGEAGSTPGTENECYQNSSSVPDGRENTLSWVDTFIAPADGEAVLGVEADTSDIVIGGNIALSKRTWFEVRTMRDTQLMTNLSQEYQNVT